MPPKAASPSDKTFFFLLIREVLTSHLKRVRDTANARDQGWKSFFIDKKLSQKKQDVIDEFISGVPKGGIKPPQQGLADFLPSKTDQETKQFFVDKVAGKKSEDAQKVLIPGLSQQLSSAVAVHGCSNAGSSDEAVRVAKQKINDVYSFCSDLGLLNQDFDENDPLHIFAYGTVLYLSMRSESAETLTKSKCSALIDEYNLLNETVASIRASDKGNRCHKHILAAVAHMKSKNSDLCEESAWGFKVPFTVAFATIAQVPFSYKPSDGELGSIMGYVEEMVKKLEKRDLEEKKVVATP